jgi:hypothetical protein
MMRILYDFGWCFWLELWGTQWRDELRARLASSQIVQYGIGGYGRQLGTGCNNPTLDGWLFTQVEFIE